MRLRCAGPGVFSAITITALAATVTLGVRPVRAQQSVPFSEVHTVAGSTTGVRQEFTLQIATAGTYTVTLVELGAGLTAPLAPAPLASLQLTASSGTALVGVPLVVTGMPSATLTLSSLKAGTYVLHVIGTPGNGIGSGPFNIVVENSAIRYDYPGVVSREVKRAYNSSSEKAMSCAELATYLKESGLLR